MTKLKSAFFLLLVAGLLSSCAKSLTVNYSVEGNSTISYQPQGGLSAAYITLDGKEIVSKKNIKDVTVTGVPSGEHTMKVISKSIYVKKQEVFNGNVTTKEGQTQEVLSDYPGLNSLYWILIATCAISSTLVLLN